MVKPFSSYLCYMINTFMQKHRRELIGAIVGAVAGGLYYYFVGCKNGSCIIASNPFISIPYGAVLGYLFAGIFSKKEQVKSEVHENS